MAYIDRRRVHDADAHIMEPPTWLRDHADPDIRDRLAIPAYANELAQTGDAAAGDAPDPDELDAIFARLADRHRSDEFLRDEETDVMNRKNFAATGSFLAEDRPRVLDFIGVDSQLMFNTFHNSRLYEWEHPDASGRVDLDLAYGAARAHNRGMTEFCSVDDRLLPTCYVPLADFDRAEAMATEAIDMGAAALLVASGCPAGHSPSHRSLDPVWRQAEEAGIPVVFHVGGTGALIDPAYFDNGLPIPPDFHGGEENFRSVDYMAIPFPPMQTLATMIFDGVLERHPQLRVGVIEQGCIWLPSWLKQMESAMEAFGRHEDRLRDLSLTPREVRRAAGSGDAVPDRGHRLGHRPGRARHLVVQHRLPTRRGRPTTVRAVRGEPRRPRRVGPGAVLRRQLHRSHGIRRRSTRVTTHRDEATVERELGDRNAWLALGVVTLVFFLVVTDVSAVNVAFPSIRDDFDVSEATLGWIISGYAITVAALLLVAGRYADSYGRKRLFLPGVAIFTVGSMLCALSPNAGFLIGSRVVQGVGGAIILGTAIAVVLPDFPANKRSTVIGITGATGALGAVVGPALGAVITDVWSWHGIFWINVPLATLVLAISPRLLRESKNPDATGKIDLVGVPIGIGGVGLVMFAIVRSESWGIFDPRVLALAAAGLVLMWVLVRRSRHQSEPLLELDLFKLRSFASTNAGLALYSIAFTSGFLANSLLLQELWDEPLSTVGLALVPAPLIGTFVSPVAGRYADRIGHRWILAVGSALCAIGYLLQLALLDDESSVWTLFVPLSLIVGVGVGATIATWSSAGLTEVRPAQFGTANATVRTTQQVGYALGISVIVAILANVSTDPQLSAFRWAWLFVGVSYLAAAIIIAITFPAGSTQQRAAA